jgi:hypothetical protein
MPYEGLKNHHQHKNAELNQQAELLFDGYVDLIATVFANSHDIEEMIETANDFFTTYQEINSKRISLDSVETGNIDCTSAAMVCGIWWWLVSGLNPYYFVENDLVYESPRGAQYDTGSALAHSLVGLPLSPKATTQEVEAAYYALAGNEKSPGKLSNQVVFVEYRKTKAKDRYEFRKISPHRVPMARMFFKTNDFIKSQIMRFKPDPLIKTDENTVSRYDVIHGLLSNDNLEKKVKAAMRMGLGVEGDYRDVTELEISTNTGAHKRDVSPTVVNDATNNSPITIFHLAPTNN